MNNLLTNPVVTAVVGLLVGALINWRTENRRWKREDQTRYNQERAIVYRTYSKELGDADRLATDELQPREAIGTERIEEELREQFNVILLLSSPAVTEAAESALRAAIATLERKPLTLERKPPPAENLRDKREAFIQAAREELGVEKLQWVVDLPPEKRKTKMPFGTRPRNVFTDHAPSIMRLLQKLTEKQQRPPAESPNSEDKEQKSPPG